MALDSPVLASMLTRSMPTDLGVDAVTVPRWSLGPDVVAVAAYKGGVGKSTLANELAWLFRAVLVDLDWDWGGVTRSWGYRYETRKTAPLLDSLESGRPPKPIPGKLKADLVPSHPDLEVVQPPADAVATMLEKWAEALGRTFVVDTHPGGHPLSHGASAAAKVVVVPTELERKPLDALEGMLRELADYPLLVVPSQVPSTPPRRQVRRLEEIVTRYDVPVTSPIYNYPWIGRRERQMAITSADPLPAAHQAYVGDVVAVAEQVVHYATAA